MFDICGSLHQLHAAGLYSNVVELCNLANYTKELYTEGVGQQIQSILADSYFELKEWKRAESIYRQILQCKKYARTKQQQSVNNSNSNPPPHSQELEKSEVEMKFKLYQCYVGMGQSSKAAIETLQSIPAKIRSAKVNMALAKLYQSASQVS